MKVPWLNTIQEVGITADTKTAVAREVIIVNLFSFFTSCLVTLYGVVFYFICKEPWVLYPALMFCGGFLFVIFILNRFQHYSGAKLFLQMIFCMVILYYGPILGEATEVQLLGLLLIAVPMLICNRRERFLRIVCLVMPVLSLVFLELNNRYGIILPFPFSAEIQYVFRWLIMGVVLLLNVMIIGFYQANIASLLNVVSERNETLEEQQIAIWAQKQQLDQMNIRLAEHNKILEKEVLDRTAIIVKKSIELQLTLTTINNKNVQLRFKEEELQRNVEVLKEAQQALLKAKEVSEKANNAKTVFLRDISHEIRNPLNALLGIIHVLRKEHAFKSGSLSGEKKLLDSMHSIGLGLLEMVNNNLEMSRIEAGKCEEIILQAFSLPDWLNEVTDIYKVVGDVRAVKVELAMEEGLPYRIVGDRPHMTQVLNNLISNAIKFSPKQGLVQLHCYTGENVENGTACLFFRIKDSGEGIADKKLELIFEPFEQANKMVYYQHGGTGLGLSISRRLVESMGGTITVESVEGKGTSFLVCLPLQISHDKVRENTIKPNPAIIVPPDKKVLIMEDNEMNLVMMSRFIGGMGITVHEADNGVDGLAMAHTLLPDLIIMDMQMPGMHGKEVIKRIRNTPILQDIPVIVVSADAFTDQQNEGYHSGVDEYLIKPIAYPRLQEIITQYLMLTPQQ
jgi:signal transduction histidine kinase/CheY-like chemotaxis protein